MKEKNQTMSNSKRAKRKKGNSLERLQARHGPRCSCNSPRPAVANLIPSKTARIRKTARGDTQHKFQNLNSLQPSETGMAAEAVADRSGSGLTNVTTVQP